ncbi:FAD-binding oxidoreductase [Knoellia sp. 3-2P3]|uniref:FAD-binding protein n=1 Tax=unclassified Knoellia TaxID=2618719 RepID=UPI0023DAE8D7|nr:FAD-binding oxidoreductase [Knoellia sp. 3-2P3]MDF2093106.1 FAD-binding oxidoreductase [Knoellia sp. 3-2P3]
MKGDETLLSGWGRTNFTSSLVTDDETAESVSAAIRGYRGERGLLVRGLGRSYGDAAQNSGGRTLRLRTSPVGEIGPDGQVDLHGGLSVGELLTHVVPRGWFVPVTPGTKHITIGGGLAADVHGKNHHRDGSLGAHVVEIDLVDGTGALRTLRREEPLFDAVIGGMGLSGVITRARLRLVPIQTASMRVCTRRTADLDETMGALADADQTHRYTVAWLDTLAHGKHLGRGVVSSGEHAPPASLDDHGRSPLALARFSQGLAVAAPPTPPFNLLSPAGMRLFNQIYYHRAPLRPRTSHESISSFFYPLDVVNAWNRAYGPRGFVQYQFAVPHERTVREVIECFQRNSNYGFLAVLKRFGPASGAPLSFPTKGWTLAVDFPATRELAGVLDRLDEMVVAGGGRVYLAKDARMNARLLPQMYPQLERWRELRATLDPRGIFVSDLSRRLQLC